MLDVYGSPQEVVVYRRSKLIHLRDLRHLEVLEPQKIRVGSQVKRSHLVTQIVQNMLKALDDTTNLLVDCGDRELKERARN